MEEKISNRIQGQRFRHRRVERMRRAIIAILAGWALLLTVLVTVLTVRLFSLEGKLDALAKTLADTENAVAGDNSEDARMQGQKAGPKEGEKAQAAEKLPDEEASAGSEAAVPESQKVYLTFDDGPSENTAKILDILKEKNIKGTFFVIGKEDEASKALYQRIVEEGHTLGMHSFSHKYSVIYESLDAFSEDVNHLQSYLAEVTGVTPTVMRFPGGSGNQVSNTDMSELIRYVKEKGIEYYDWNIDSGDATGQAYTPEELVENVMKDIGRHETSIVLMHDIPAKPATVEALAPLIDKLQAAGVELLPIGEDTTPIQQVPADRAG
ncbi:polysaccharide deacetylase family protein [Lachnospiraceae bacterium 29-84]